MADPSTIVALDKSTATRFLVLVGVLVELALAATHRTDSVTEVSTDHSLEDPTRRPDQLVSCQNEWGVAIVAGNFTTQ